MVQAGLGFDINTSTTLYLTVAKKSYIFIEVAAEVTTEVVMEIIGRIKFNFNYNSSNL